MKFIKKGVQDNDIKLIIIKLKLIRSLIGSLLNCEGIFYNGVKVKLFRQHDEIHSFLVRMSDDLYSCGNRLYDSADHMTLAQKEIIDEVFKVIGEYNGC